MNTRRILCGAAVGLMTMVAAIMAAPAPAGASPSIQAMAKATPICNKAIIADKPITKKQLAACKVISGTITTTCTHQPNVFEVYVAEGADALLRVGHRPMVYSSGNLYDSDGISLCGDPIGPSLTPPAPAMTKVQIRTLFTRSGAAKTGSGPPASTPTTSAAVPTSSTGTCAAFFTKYGGISQVPAGMTQAQAETAIANACSSTELLTQLTASEAGDSTAIIQLSARQAEALVCPSNPHTRLCP